MLTPLFYEDPSPYIGYQPPFLSQFSSPPTPSSTVFSVVMFLWVHGSSNHIWCAILLNDNMDLRMSSLGTLVPEGP